MTSTIHMETELVRQVFRQFLYTGSEIESEARSLSNAISALKWSGPSRDKFEADFIDLVQVSRASCLHSAWSGRSMNGR
jgi:hypothetical protein